MAKHVVQTAKLRRLGQERVTLKVKEALAKLEKELTLPPKEVVRRKDIGRRRAGRRARRPESVPSKPPVPQPPPGSLGKPVSREDLARLNLTLEDLEASVCRASFYEFVKTMWSATTAETPVWNWHIEYLCDRIQELVERVFRGLPKLHDLVVNISPGTTKSTIMSVMLPAWCWTRMPNFQFIGVSYSDKLALDLSVKCRDVVRSEKYRALFPEVVWRDDQDTKSFFKNTKGGWRFCAGTNGTVTGYHAHLIVIDDPIDPKGTVSELELQTANRWIVETLSTRKVDKRVTLTLLVMQRLHQDDPTAVFLRRKNVEKVVLPAEKTKDVYPPELARNYKKGLMDPVRLDREVLADEKAKGQYYYASQFLQTPVPRGGGMFKTWRVKAAPLPDDSWFVHKVRYWDKAGTLGGSGAFTVGCLMGLDKDGRFWVLDVVRVRLDSFERESLIRKTAEEDGTEVLVGLEQEPGSGGKGSAEDTARRLAGFRVRVVKVDKTTGGKEFRADPFSVQVNSGNVYVPTEFWDGDRKGRGHWRQDSWAWEFVEELKYFPVSRFKDQVDASSGAFQLLAAGMVKVGAVA